MRVAQAIVQDFISAVRAQPLTQVFISYSRDNRETAEYVAQGLAGLGIDVWWDRELPGGAEFSEVIEKQLTEAHVVIVLWSASSTRSSFVRDESMRALEAGKLLPVRIEAVVPPLGFGQIHALDLLNWNGGRDDPAFVALADEVRKRLGQPLVPRQRYLPPRRRYRPTILAGVGLLVAAIVATGGWQFYNASESRRNLRLGLEEQFGREPNLQAARNYYLDALAHMAGNARARYYLGHVYAQLGEMELARISFERAAHDREGLDKAQLADASMRVAALSPAPEPASLVRADVSSAPPKDLPAPVGAQPADTRPAEPETADRQVKAAPPILGSIGGIRDPSAAASAAALARLPRLPPAPETRRRVDQLVDQMFSDDSETRITATTTLVTDPDLLSDAVPLAVNEAMNRLNAGRGKLAASVQSGVVNTLVLLQSAMPGTLLVHRGDIERLLKRAAPIGKYTATQAEKVQTLLASAAERRPVAFIQIANEAQRPIAEALAVRLRVAGYEAAGIELVGTRAPASSQIRVQGKSDRGFARWLAKVVRDADGEAVAVQALRNAAPSTDTFEIWFDRDLCTAERNLPKCGA
jgi:hypothetical protein